MHTKISIWNTAALKTAYFTHANTPHAQGLPGTVRGWACSLFEKPIKQTDAHTQKLDSTPNTVSQTLLMRKPTWDSARMGLLKFSQAPMIGA